MSETTDAEPEHGQPDYEQLLEHLRLSHLQPVEFAALASNSARVRHCLRQDLIVHQLRRYLSAARKDASPAGGGGKCAAKADRLLAEADRLQKAGRAEHQAALQLLYKVS